MSQWLWPCVVLVAAFGAGCETLQKTDEPEAGAPAKEAAAEPDALIAPTALREIGYSLEWLSDLALADQERVEHATAMDGTLITIELPGNMVSAISLRDGSPMWRRLLGSPNDVLYKPTWGNEHVVINSGSTVYQLQPANGKLESLSRPASPVANSPAVKNRYAFYGTISGKVIAHDLRAGYAKAEYDMGERILARPVFVRNDMFVVNASGQFARLATTGPLLGLVWANKVWERVSNTPVVSRLGIFFTSDDRTLYAIDPDTGSEMWKQRLEEPFRGGAWVDETLVITQSADDVTRTFDAADNGRMMWTLSPSATPLARVDDHLVMYRDDEILIVQPQTGKVLDQAKTKPLAHLLHVGEGVLIAITREGRVARLDPTE